MQPGEKGLMEPFPPEFMPGDLVEIVGMEFPIGSGRIKSWLGVFQEPGFPADVSDLPIDKVGKVLNERLVGTVNNGEWCLVVAASFYDGDKKWYYLLRGVGFKKCFGWSRTVKRMRKIQP